MEDTTSPREVSMLNRAMVAGIAETLLDAGDEVKANALVNAVRCCDYFPECSHIADWSEEWDNQAATLDES